MQCDFVRGSVILNRWLYTASSFQNGMLLERDSDREDGTAKDIAVCPYKLIDAQYICRAMYSASAAYAVASSDELPIDTVGGLAPSVRKTLPCWPRRQISLQLPPPTPTTTEGKTHQVPCNSLLGRISRT